MQKEPLPQTTAQSYLKIISIIHIALLASQLLFGLTAFSMTPQKGIAFSSSNVFMYVVPFMAVMCVTASFLIFNKQVDAAINKPILKEKLMAYQGALI